MDLFKFRPQVIHTAVLISSFLLTACDSGTKIKNANSQIGAQAIDGYIVNGQVLCDDDDNGRTTAGGWLECPTSTTLITVNGGQDVGFDETATTGGTLFTGSLQAPGDARYITPTTSLATQLAHTNDSFDPDAYDEALSLIQSRLGLESIDLTGNPATNAELARLNVALNLLAQQFSSDTSDYGVVMQAISQVFESSASIDMTDGVALISAVNQQLLSIAPYLSLNSTAEITTGNSLTADLTAIESTDTIAQLENKVEQIQTPSVFTIDQNAPFISFHSGYYYQQQYGSYNSSYNRDTDTYNLAQFMSSETTGAGYSVAIAEYNTDELVFNTDAFTVNRTVSGSVVDVAVEVESILDDRRLSVILKGVQLSMNAGDNRSIKIDVPENTMLDAQYYDKDGIVTQVTEVAKNDLFASAEDGTFKIDFDDVKRQLYDHGYPDFLNQSGHYKMTVVLEGLNFSLANNDVVTAPDFYTVSIGSNTVAGAGIQGYLSLD